MYYFDILEWNFPRFRTETYKHLVCVNCLISLKEEAFVYHSLVTHKKNEVEVYNINYEFLEI